MRKRKYYLILDTETATLPFAKSLCHTAKESKNLAIARPLVYDIGWTIMQTDGTIVDRKNFLVQETFFVPQIFNTAYYQDKRPLYMKALADGEIQVATWNQIAEILLEDMQKVDLLAAYNAQFDFKKAIPFTEEYIKALYSDDYNDWERHQHGLCRKIVSGAKWDGENPDYMIPEFEFRGDRFPIVDLWWLACDRLINIDKYRNYCLENSLLTASAQYFKTSAETAFQYLGNQYDFVEDHTALSDAEIESKILAKALRKGKVEPNLEAFPFRKLGTTIDYIHHKKPKYHNIVIEALYDYIDDNDGVERAQNGERYWVRIVNQLSNLIREFEYTRGAGI